MWMHCRIAYIDVQYSCRVEVAVSKVVTYTRAWIGWALQYGVGLCYDGRCDWLHRILRKKLDMRPSECEESMSFVTACSDDNECAHHSVYKMQRSNIICYHRHITWRSHCPGRHRPLSIRQRSMTAKVPGVIGLIFQGKAFSFFRCDQLTLSSPIILLSILLDD